MGEEVVYLDKEEIYDILCDCGLFEVYTKSYGSIDVLDEDTIMDEFIPQLILYISEKCEKNKLIVE